MRGVGGAPLALAGVVVLAALVWLFARPDGATPPRAHAAPPLVTVEGCAERLELGACRLPADGRLVLTSSPARALAIQLGDGAAARTTTQAEHALEVPPSAARLVVSWRGQVLRDVALLTATATDTSIARRTFLSGRQARRDGRIEDAIALLTRAVAEADAAHEVSTALHARSVLAYALIEAGRPREAVDTMEAMPTLDRSWVEGEVMRLLLLGWALQSTARPQEAMDAYRASTRHAQRLRDTWAASGNSLARDGLHQTALLHLRLGRVASAWRLLRELAAAIPAQASCDERADLVGNLGWVGLMGLESRVRGVKATLEEARAMLSDAAAIAEGCPEASAQDRANHHVNLGMAELRAGHIVSARVQLERAGAGLDPAALELRADVLELEALVELEEVSLAAAARAADALWALGDASRRHDLLWTAWYLRARLAEAREDLDEAALAYRSAEDAAAREALAVPLEQGGLSAAALRRPSAGRWVELELRRGRPQEALRVLRNFARRGVLSASIPDRLRNQEPAAIDRLRARLARARRETNQWSPRAPRGAAALAEVDAVHDALRALIGVADDIPLAAPRAGEVLVTWFDTTTTWYAVTARDGEPPVFTRVPAPPESDQPRGLAEWALAPVLAQLDGATRVRLQPPAWLWPVDLHDTPALLDHFDVAYGLDVPQRLGRRDGPPLIVGAGGPDLPAVEAEISAVAAQLPGAVVLRDASARVAAVQEALAASSHLHYAGHAEYAGVDGLDSHLVLDDGPLHAGDILFSTAVPATAVLSACESARTSTTGAGPAVGIAQALVMAGSAWVIAPTRAVNDADAAQLSMRFYAGPWTDGAAALRRVQRAEDGRRFHDFRLIEP